MNSLACRYRGCEFSPGTSGLCNGHAALFGIHNESIAEMKWSIAANIGNILGSLIQLWALGYLVWKVWSL